MPAGDELRFEAEAVAVDDLDTDSPKIHFRENGEEKVLACDFIAGCDGFHGICREVIPSSTLQTYDREYPFGWVGILSESPPVSRRIDLPPITPTRFALFTMRSPAAQPALPSVPA